VADPIDSRKTFTTDEGVLANMWVMEAIVELLERKGICTKQEVHDMVTELRKRHEKLNGKIIVPGPPPNTKEEQFLVDHVLKLIDAVDLRPSEAQELLRRVSLAIDQTGEGWSPSTH
jgi:hypothetical protein